MATFLFFLQLEWSIAPGTVSGGVWEILVQHGKLPLTYLIEMEVF